MEKQHKNLGLIDHKQITSLYQKLSHLTTNRRTIEGICEIRYLSEFKVNSTILNTILNQTYSKISFNLMMITNDHKILLLHRTQSFHFPKVVQDLKLNKINLNLLASLYTSELEKITKMESLHHNQIQKYFPKSNGDYKPLIRIFPGGHSLKNEPVILTLTRELQEETHINASIKDLRFHQSCIFSVLIFDSVVQKYFKNFIFPIKVNMTSHTLKIKFQETKHVTSPTFIDIQAHQNLFDLFVQVQQQYILR